MLLHIHDPLVMAIDLRFRRSGFAIFEGPRRLLDYGTVAFPSGQDEMAGNRLSEILKLSLPNIIVVKKERWATMMAHPRTEPLIETLNLESERRRIQIRLLEQGRISSTFRDLGCETRAENAAVLARIFPELVWQLPPKRKPWQAEHPRQTVFDAIALGLAYWQHETSAAANSKVELEIQEDAI